MKHLLRRLPSHLGDEQGTGLFLSMMLLLLGTLSVGSLLVLSSANYRVTMSSIQAIKAQYIAEAGIYRAIAEIQRNPQGLAEFLSDPFGEGSYSVEVQTKSLTRKEEETSKIYILTSVGQVSPTSRKVVRVEYDPAENKISNWE